MGQEGPFSVYLFNVRTACASDVERCNDAVSALVQTVTSVASANQSTYAFVADRAYAVLRIAGFGKEATKGVKEPNKQLVVLPFVEGIEALFVIDGENSVRYVNRDDMAVTGLTEKALFDLASRNAARLPSLTYEPIRDIPGLYIMAADDGLGTSRAFDTALWQKLETTIGGPVAMAVPTRDWVLFTRADQPELVTKLRRLAGRITKGEPHPVSDAVMTRKGNSWRSLQIP
jgi:uncharacterized protein YtpQ (UPF0354 family)